MIEPVPQGETRGMAAPSNGGIKPMYSRLLLATSLVVLLGDVRASAQIGYPGGGIGYPGGGIGYPGGTGYPGGGGMGIPGVGGRQRGQNNRPTDTVTGKINRISSSQLVLDVDDGTQVQIALDRNTRYFDISGGQARYGDFDTGDRVSVDAARDNQNYMHGLRVNLQDKASGSGRTSSEDRASSSDRAGSSSSGSNDDDPDRPRLKRSPNSASSDSSSSSSGSGSSGSGSGNSGSRAQTSTSDSNTVADNRPSTTAAPRPIPRESDDPGPPVLKRNAPARVDNTPPAGSQAAASSSSASSDSSDPVAQARAIADRYKNGAPELAASATRPSIKAQDANGVTRAPAAPVIGPATAPSFSPNGERQPSPSDAFSGPRSSDPVVQGRSRCGVSVYGIPAKLRREAVYDPLPDGCGSWKPHLLAGSGCRYGRCRLRKRQRVLQEHHGERKKRRKMISRRQDPGRPASSRRSYKVFFRLRQTRTSTTSGRPRLTTTPPINMTTRSIRRTRVGMSPLLPNPTSRVMSVRSGSIRKTSGFCESRCRPSTCRDLLRSTPWNRQLTTITFSSPIRSFSCRRIRKR